MSLAWGLLPYWSTTLMAAAGSPGRALPFRHPGFPVDGSTMYRSTCSPINVRLTLTYLEAGVNHLVVDQS
jgi:hypothetical protein